MMDFERGIIPREGGAERGAERTGLALEATRDGWSRLCALLRVRLRCVWRNTRTRWLAGVWTRHERTRITHGPVAVLALDKMRGKTQERARGDGQGYQD